MNEKINDIIDKLHFKSFVKVKDHVKKLIPEVSDKEIREALKQRVKDPRIKLVHQKPYMIKIFSRSLNTYFHDIFDNGKHGDPRYFHIFIGTNNRFAVVYPLENKSGKMVIGLVSKFVKKYQPVKLTSDHESGFVDKNVLDYLKSNGVAVKIVHDQNHSTLGIIDRFTRTLRDMCDDKIISTVKMNKLIDVYNNTYHTSIGMTPKEMFSDIRLEKEYIDKCVVEVEKQREIKDFE
jgi:hypothetical protein